jgi:hypothetical protein
MSNHSILVDKLKAGNEVFYDQIDASIADAIKSTESVRIRPLQQDEVLKPGQIVMQAFGGKTRLRIVSQVTGDSCQLKNARGLNEGWVLRKTILGVVSDTSPAVAE